MKAVLKEKVYECVEERNAQTAKIIFKKHDNEDCWYFSKCEIESACDNIHLAYWQFLHGLSAEILRLNKEVHGE